MLNNNYAKQSHSAAAFRTPPMRREWGGYLQIELPEKEEFFQEYENCLLRMNSGRGAIYAALKILCPTKIYTPFYLCESVLDVYKQLNITYEFYNIDENFLPISVTLSPREALIWPHYFGVMSQKARQIVAKKYSSGLIIDNTQAFFCPPTPEFCNVYSCRKFLGTPDGAYLIGNPVTSGIEYTATYSHQRYYHLLKSMELGTNAAYSEHLENERSLGEEVGEMSELTRRILCSLDYTAIQKKRAENFNALHKALGQWNMLSLPESPVSPVAYPFLFKNSALRPALIEQHIYIPQWWKHVAEYDKANEFEKILSRFLIPLPIDQRYNEADMLHIAEVILRHIGHKKLK